MHLIQIDNPKINDYERVIKLHNYIYSKYPWYIEYSVKETVKRMTSELNPKIFVMENIGKYLGFAICYERYKGYYHIWQIGVLEEYRRQGIASKIYDAIETFAKKKYKGVTINTFNKYTESLRLAIKRGYEIYDIEKEGEFKNDPKIKLKLAF